MGRGNGRNRKRKQQQHEKPTEPAVKQPKKEEVWRCHKQIPENSYFRRYYQLQFQPYFQNDVEEFQRFWLSLKERLPVVFRVNCNQPNYRAFIHKLTSEDLVKWEKLEGEFEPQQPIKVECIDWYPDQLVYTINTTKQQFKKSKLLQPLHSLVEKATDAGLVTRQQLVSMMPPLFLDVQSTDLVMDMCAAPGSKTSQMLEMLYSHQSRLPTGGVIANDVEYSRAQMLIHQVQRSWTAGMAVINHNGQFLPQLHTEGKQKLLFDKVLADVPCSGDGATRKLPNKWSDWHSNDGAVLHPLQLNILMRGINLLKEDGLLLYSTCSMNPFEDEAVLVELMRRVKSGIEIVDIHNRGVKGRRGLNHWHVLESKGKEVSASEMKAEGEELFNVYTEYIEGVTPPKIKKSLFPESLEVMEKFGIANSMRILPHDHNSGGFFVALLRKTKNFHWKHEDSLSKTASNHEELEEKALEAQMEKVDAELPKEQDEGEEQGKPRHQPQPQTQEKVEQTSEVKKPLIPNQRPKTKHTSKIVEQYVPIELEEFRIIQSFYGIESDLFRNNLFVKKSEQCRKKVTLVSDGVSNYVRADTTNKLKLINMGCKAFEKGKESFAGSECLYRLCQDSIHFLLPVLTKRKVRVTLEVFRLLIQHITIKHEQIADEATRHQLASINQGSFAVYIDEVLHGKPVIDALVAQNYRTAMNIMVSKVDLESLRIRYC